MEARVTVYQIDSSADDGVHSMSDIIPGASETAVDKQTKFPFPWAACILAEDKKNFIIRKLHKC